MKIYTKISDKFIFNILLIYSIIGLIPVLPTTLYYSKTIIITLFAILLLVKNRDNKIPTKLVFLLTGYVFILVFSTLLSNISINLIAFSLELIPVLIFLCYLTLKFNDEHIVKILLSVFYFSSFFGVIQFLILPQYELSLNGIWFKVSSELPLLMKRPGSIFGNSNVFGAFNVIILILILFQKQLKCSSKEKLFIQFLIILNIVLIAKSRSSLFSVYFIYLIYYWKENSLLLFTTLLAIPIFIFGIINSIISNEELNQIFRLSDLFLNERNSFTIRKEIFEYSFQIIQQNIFFGVGPGNILPFFQLQNAPHNGPETAGLWIIIEKGIISYLFYILLLIKLILSKDLFKKMIAIGILIIGIFETVMIQSQILGIILILSSLNYRKNVI